jgi:phosphoribosylaminoimidazole-succinocarboxamide synthase
MENGFQGKEGQQVPEMADEWVTLISERYIELFEQVTGEPFLRADNESMLERIEQSIRSFSFRAGGG